MAISPLPTSIINPSLHQFLRIILIGTALFWCALGMAQTVPSGFNDNVVMSGFTAPVGFVFDDNDRMYVWEKGGRVRIVENGVLQATPLLDISEEVANWRDHGMLGFALDPNFLSNGFIYVLYGVDRHHLMNFGTGSYNANTNEYFAATIMRLTRYTAKASSNFTSVDYNSRWVILGANANDGVPLLHQSHSTGTIIFGEDGTLMAAVGDGASYSSTDVGSASETYWQQGLNDGIIRTAENVGAYRSQMVTSYNGNLLRLDPATGQGLPSNPFFDPNDPSSVSSRTWAVGLRNPFRMTLRKGTGSTNPADGDPGTLYIGDVGWGTWEDINVCTEAGMNFGWPIFEGLEGHSGYINAAPFNMDAPDPLYNGTTCPQPYFRFTDLLIQDTPLHSNLFPAPCDPNQQIPASIPTFIHARPAIDIRHGSNPNARTGIFNGNTATVVSLNASGSPVPGPVFNGNASVGGVWLTGSTWPAGYQNVYYHADYTKGWIKKFEFDGTDKPTGASDFADNLGPVVFLNEGPDGCLWYVQYGQSAIRKICPNTAADLPPVAIATQDVTFGPGPLTVNFVGNTSYDPENAAVTYDWDFGDGNSSTQANPSHTFTATHGVPITFTVTLTVTDNVNQSHSTSLTVSVNNSPPQINIISFNNGAEYPVGVDTTFSLQAYVYDAEHGPTELTYEWQTTLHHNAHEHPEPADSNVATAALVSGEGCGGDNYWYSIQLTVTDDHGLAATTIHNVYPRCSAPPPIPIISATPMNGDAPLLVSFDASGSYDQTGISNYSWDLGNGNSATGITASHTFNDPGPHVVILSVTNTNGIVRYASTTINVLSHAPPQCVGTAGSLLREYWTGISGSSISDLLNNSAYPSSPNGSSFMSSFQGPTNWGSDYGTRVRGYLIAPESGQYIFNITSDDQSELYLSPNADPANKQLIANVSGYTGALEFSKFASQRSAAINLEAGNFYYVEMLHKEGSGGDHLAAYWETPSNSVLTLISGQDLAPWQDCGPRLHARVYLGSCYDPSTALMRDELRSLNLIPTTEPYTALGFTHVIGGGETVQASVFNTTGPNAIVDWMLLELRDKNSPFSVVATRSALLQRDGDIVDVDGTSPVQFSASSNEYRVAIRHRNHLGVMSMTSLPFGNGTQTVDMTLLSTPTYGYGARRSIGGGKTVLWMGNTKNDGKLKYTGSDNDRDPILQAVGGTIPTNFITGYLRTDVNLDGTVKYTGLGNDRDLILNAIGGTQPTLTRTEQLP